MAVLWTMTDPFHALGRPRVRVRARQRGSATVVAVRGEVDLATAPELAGKLAQLSPSAMRDLVVDLDGVDHLGSAGLSTLVHLRASVHECGGTLRLVCGRAQIRRLFRLTDLDKMFALYGTVTAALGADDVLRG